MMKNFEIRTSIYLVRRLSFPSFTTLNAQSIFSFLFSETARALDSANSATKAWLIDADTRETFLVVERPDD